MTARSLPALSEAPRGASRWAMAAWCGLLVAGLVAPSVRADDWGDLASISTTMGVNDGRICTGEGSRGDIGCPANAPYVNRTSGAVGIQTNNPGEPLHVGNITSGGRVFIGEDGASRRGLLLAALLQIVGGDKLIIPFC